MSLEEKFSRMAWGFSERSYVNLDAFMGHRLDLILRWGAPLNPGDRVLELGCGDGYLGCLLAKCGMDYWGVDIAPGMVEAARERARAQGVNAWFGVMDIHDPSIEGSFDAIIALMRTFFRLHSGAIESATLDAVPCFQKDHCGLESFLPSSLEGSHSICSDGRLRSCGGSSLSGADQPEDSGGCPEGPIRLGVVASDRSVPDAEEVLRADQRGAVNERGGPLAG
jgi:SAM-dependent methyltransferase